MATIESVRTSVDVNIKANGKQEITGVVLNSVLNNIVDLSEDAESTLKSHGVLLEKHSEELEQKANEDGKYPQMTSGFASNLVGRGEAVDAEIGFRASGGMSIEDGAARVKELHGNSLVWNQYAKDLSAIGTQYYSNNFGSATYDNNTKSVECKVTSLGASEYYLESFWSCVGSHKYMASLNVKSYSTASGLRIYHSSSLISAASNVGKTNEWGNCVCFFKASDSNERCRFRPFGGGSASLTETGSVFFKNPLLIDLTQMFGAGNEPTTLEEFYNRIPQNVDLYAYNEGEIISTNAEGIKSVGFNAWDEEWVIGQNTWGEIGPHSTRVSCKNPIRVIGGEKYFYAAPSNLGTSGFTFKDSEGNNVGDAAIGVMPNKVFTTPTNAAYMFFYVDSNYTAPYKNDICINLVHSGYRNGEYQPYMQFIRNLDNRIKEAFPNGLRSAGSASDKVYNKNGKGYIEKRIGVVDMGALPWVSVSGIFKCDFSAYTKKHSSNILCSAYVTSSVREQEKTIYYADSFFGSYALTIKDSAYTNIDTFKAAVQGIPLYYELAEPIITEYDEPFNLDYEVWDFGTEQMLSSRPSAPIKAKIAYGFNAVDSVRTAQIEIAELKTQIAQMQTLMASLTASPAMLEE